MGKKKAKKEKEPWKPSKEKIDFLQSHRVMDLIKDVYKVDPLLGVGLLAAPENQDIVLDFTTPMGRCSNIYYGFVFQLPKWSFNVKKVEEFMDVSPVHADAYNLMVSQRQKIETAIKTGLSSAAEAVTHYELLAHDARRYKEVLDYFEKGQKDEHVLRSLFVDRVDAYTGEGYSMITMTKRWPTIITDFIRMKTEWDDINNIRKGLDVSQAEATVLKTKNELYVEWKTLFRPTIVDRYARIKTMVNARKRSVDEYKKWLKPYIARHKMMQEMPEGKASGNVTSAIMVPGFGQAVMFSGVKLWIWKPFSPTEPGKPESFAEHKPWGDWEIDPYDDFVKDWVRYINYKYKTDYGDEEIRKLMKVWSTSSTETPFPLIDPTRPYYIFFDALVLRSVIKTPPPSGVELENIMLNPMRTYIMSQNVLLLHLIEIDAIEKQFDREVDELIGASHLEEKEKEDIEKMFEPNASKKEPGTVSSIFSSAGSAKKSVVKTFKPFSKYFFRPGPYESNFRERVTKIYLVGAGGIYQSMVDYWKKGMDVK